MKLTRRVAPLTIVSAMLALAATVPSLGASATSIDESSTDTDYGRMILVLDSSGSMAEPAGDGTSRIEAAKQALGSVIEALPAEAQVGLRVYGAEVFSRREPGACKDSQLVVPPGTDNHDELTAAVASYEPYGETPIAFALRAAAKDIGGEGKRSIVLVSDGIATCEPDPCDVAAELAEAGIDLQIDVVGLSVNPTARAQLRCIAAAGNGTYYDADSADDIVESLSTASERALRPFQIDGTPVDGGPELALATLLETGTYADEIRPDEEKWYRYERTMPGSTVIVSRYEQQPGAFSNLFMDVTTEDGSRCSGGPGDHLHAIFTGYSTIVDGHDHEDTCSNEPLLIKVSTAGDEMTEFGLGIVEEPEVTNAGTLPAAVDDADFTMPMPVVTETVTPGSSFGDAAVLEAGHSYSTSIVAGEVQAFRVAVDWGQQLAVRIDRPGLTPAQYEGIDASTNYFDLQILNPERASVYDDLTGDDVGTSGRAGAAPTRQVVGTVPVRWRNREGASPAYTSGDYYVLYSAGFKSDRSVELPYSITVEVTGEKAGAPTYAEIDPPANVDDPGQPSDPDESESSTTIIAAAVLGAIALGACGFGLLLLRRRRRS